MKTSEIFRCAKRRMIRNRDEYICHAIARVRGPTCDEKSIAKKIIMERIKPWGTADNWIATKIGKAYDEQWWRGSRRDRRKWKLRWLDKLIAEFEAKGN